MWTEHGIIEFKTKHELNRAASNECAREPRRNFREEQPWIESPYEDLLLFPVELRTLFWEKSNANLFNDNDAYVVECKRHFGVLDVDREELFAAVTDGYLLTTNEEAIGYGKRILQKLFVQYTNKESEIECLIARLSPNRAACELDLCRAIEKRQPLIDGSWIPFLRIRNSYNKTQTLQYIFGFQNVLFNIALLFKPLEMPHYYTRKGLDEKINIWCSTLIHNEYIQTKIKSFAEKIQLLKDINLSRTLILALYCKYFKLLRHNSNDDDEIKWTLNGIDIAISEISEHIGLNAETMLLVFARCIEEEGDRYNLSSDQIKLGTWSDDLVEQLKTEGDRFSWYDYIGKEAFDTVSWYETNK